MYDFDESFSDRVMDLDSAVTQVLEMTDKGLFDTDDTKDEDLEALYER